MKNETEKNKIYEERELLNWLDRCWSIVSISQSDFQLQKVAYQQIKKCIHEAYRIPSTSEREGELEKVIIEMQKQIDGAE